MKFSANTFQCRLDSPLGRMVLAATAQGLCGAWFVDQKHLPPWADWPTVDGQPVLRAACQQLDEYFAQQRQHFELPLDLSSGTPFQQSVWQALLAIPYGGRSTYGRLGAAIDNAAAVRAVGGAVGRNPLSIIVPCHRVLGADGSLTGYAGGLARKTRLLQIESPSESLF